MLAWMFSFVAIAAALGLAWRELERLAATRGPRASILRQMKNTRLPFLWEFDYRPRGGTVFEFDLLVRLRHGLAAIKLIPGDGRFCGELGDAGWTFIPENGKPHAIINPLRQIEGACRALAAAHPDLPVQPMLCFLGRAVREGSLPTEACFGDELVPRLAQLNVGPNRPTPIIDAIWIKLSIAHYKDGGSDQTVNSRQHLARLGLWAAAGVAAFAIPFIF